jgi:hypothetical protein
VENATNTLHRLTSYSWAWYAPSRDNPDLVWTSPVDDPRVVHDLKVNDLDRLPWFYKRYPESLPRLLLPRELPVTSAPAVAVLAGTAEIPRTDVDVPQLSRLLHLCAGVVRTTERPWGTFLFRAAGSAGGRFPLEVYVAVPVGTSLPPGVHWYDPRKHALVLVSPPPAAGVPTIVVTGIPWRTGWRYRERGFRHVYWDAGSMLAQLIAAADSAGIPASLYTEFPDAEVATLVGAAAPHEWPVAVVTLGDGEPALGATGASGPPGSAARRSRNQTATLRRSRPSSSRVVRSAGWIRPAASLRRSCARRFALHCAEVPCRTGLSCTTSTGSSPGSTAGPTCRHRGS